MAEEALIKKSIDLAKELTGAKRIAGTVNEPVEKFFHRDGESAGFGKSVARIDLDAKSLFTEQWLLDTYAERAETLNAKIYEVWKDLNGTRGLQFTRSVALPGGFQDRLFKTWLTWQRRVDADGHQTFIIAICPFENYQGKTYNEVPGTENMQEATCTGVHIIKDLTESTCEWTRVLQADLRIPLPSNVLEFIAKQHIGVSTFVQVS